MCIRDRWYQRRVHGILYSQRGNPISFEVENTIINGKLEVDVTRLNFKQIAKNIEVARCRALISYSENAERPPVIMAINAPEHHLPRGVVIDRRDPQQENDQDAIIALGDIKLSQLQSYLERNGIFCEILAGGLNYNNLVLIKKVDRKIELEGIYSKEYFKIRELLYNFIRMQCRESSNQKFANEVEFIDITFSEDD
eukprot:TRINITY_DN4485_c0_g1_i1.p1 TRINITY_DN4485_c0_g1~~TRINITY_DN4485_c0_g1_i1.p1  ORF type:complete len:217 (-),score=58.95 TRINITY_DN4485_c0_g1_i1:119-709(-)